MNRPAWDFQVHQNNNFQARVIDIVGWKLKQALGQPEKERTGNFVISGILEQNLQFLKAAAKKLRSELSCKYKMDETVGH